MSDIDSAQSLQSINFSLYRPDHRAKPTILEPTILHEAHSAMSVIDVEALLGEVAAGSPCGADLEYDPAFAQMEEQAQETPERQYGETIIPAEPADWRTVKKTALALSERTRDLRVAVYLTRALLHTDGLPGFAEGLALVDGLIERFWAQVYPQLDPDDDNDPTLRVNTIVALCDPEATLHALRETPLVHSRSLGRFSLRDVQIASGALTPLTKDKEGELPTPEKINGAFQEVGSEQVQAIAATIADAIVRVQRIEAGLTDQIGVSQAPDLSALTGVLKEMRQPLADYLQRQGVGLADAGMAENAEFAAVAGTPEVGGSGPRRVVGEIASREDALRMIDKICEYFDRYEPSSPAPLLLKRAKRLAKKDFMAILLDLTPGGIEQANLIFGAQKDNAE
jgi:type VI secretion system protein ImpA